MYRSVINIRKDVPNEVLKRLAITADKAFNNHAGRASNVSSSSSPYTLVYEGGEEKFGCLELGALTLWDEKQFVSCVSSWQWIDEEDPGESCDILKVLAEPVR